MALTIVGIGVKVSGRSAWLDEPAALSYKRMHKAGCPSGGITDAGRTGPEQIEIFLSRYEVRLIGSGPYGDVRWWKGKRYVRVRGASAATPGTSNHETGRALDLTGAALEWVRAHGAEYGWIADLVKGERWHVTYIASRDRHVSEPVPTSTPTPTPKPRRRDVLIIKDANGTAYYEATDLAVRHIGDPRRLPGLLAAYGPEVPLDAAQITNLIDQANERMADIAARIAKAIPVGASGPTPAQLTALIDGALNRTYLRTEPA